MLVLWIVLGIVVVGASFFVFRTLHKLMLAARQLQRTVNIMKEHVEAQASELDADVKSLGETIEDTGRN
ncbi:MAG TPA: hypothetical protein VF711_01645 [Acidimicrobiales bacterium]